MQSLEFKKLGPEEKASVSIKVVGVATRVCAEGIKEQN